jgi:hypothetical protein
MEEERKVFNFYRSYYDVLEDIRKPEDKLTFLMALLDRQFKGIEPNLKDIPKLVYISQKHSIDKQVKGWEDKMKTKLTPPPHPSLPPTLHPLLPPTEHPTLHPSNDSVMTTEGGSGHPYLQEQEKEQEQMQMQIKEQMDFSFIPDEISQYLKSKGL